MTNSTRKIPNGFQLCPGCKGFGSVTVGCTAPSYTNHDGGRPSEEILEECEVCRGEEIVPDSDLFEIEDDGQDPDFSDGPDEFESDDIDDSMDGDAESALASAGFGTDEDYGGASDFDF